MTTWTRARLMDLLRRAADLRAMLGEPDPNADPQLVAEAHRREAAVRHQGRDSGYDPTSDPTSDPYEPHHGPEV